MFRDKLQIILGLLLVILFIGGITIQNSYLKAAGPLVLEPPVIKKDDLLRGEIFHGKVYLKNQSNTTWELIDAMPSCGCTQVSIKPTILPPKSSSEINVSVDTANSTGQKIASIKTEWRRKDDSNFKTHVDLPIRLTVRGLFSVQPRYIELGSIQWNVIQSGLGFEVNRGNSGLSWNDIEAKSPSFEINVVHQNQDAFQVTMYPKSKEPSYGYYSEQIQVLAEANKLPVGPTYIFSIKAWVDPGVKVTPRTLFSNTLLVGQTGSGVVSLATEGKEFHLLSITSPEPAFLHFDSSSKNDANNIQIPFKMIGNRPGEHSGIVTVTISIGGEVRTFSLPYISFVESSSAASSTDTTIPNLVNVMEAKR